MSEVTSGAMGPARGVGRTPSTSEQRRTSASPQDGREEVRSGGRHGGMGDTMSRSFTLAGERSS